QHQIQRTPHLFKKVSGNPASQSKGTESKFLKEFVNLKLIGEGAFGCVFNAENVLDEWNYAVKRITLRNKTDKEVFNALREVRVMAQFDHPGIVRYNSTWIETPTQEDIQRLNDRESLLFGPSKQMHTVMGNTFFIYIQMQLCKYSLEHWLERNQLSREASKMKHWFTQIVSAVEYIHGRGVIHRDLKPSNILFVEEDRLKICDLGIATERSECDPAKRIELDDESELNDVPDRTFNIGTALYMSPEQMTWDYNNKVDIFSLGLIFAEMCLPMAGKVRSEVFSDFKSGKCNKVLLPLPSEMIAFLQWLTQLDITLRPTSTEIMQYFARRKEDVRVSDSRTTKQKFEKLKIRDKKLKKISDTITDKEVEEKTIASEAFQFPDTKNWLEMSLEKYHKTNPTEVAPAGLIHEIRAELVQMEKKMAKELHDKRRMLAALEK
ncbi:hypothetical protein PFISCL1PPCAC_6764, partial [Pristionchus fissidentatus]